MKIRNIFQFEIDEKVYEHPKGVSMTTPDMALSLNDILNRFTRGIAPNVQIDGTYSNVELDASQPIEEGIDPLTELDFVRQRVAYLENQVKENQSALDQRSSKAANTKNQNQKEDDLNHPTETKLDS